MTAGPSGSTGTRIAGALLALGVLVALALLFVVLYVLLAPSSLPNAFVAMGVVALGLALASYLLQSTSRDPVLQRAVAWGLGAMGFVMVFATLWIVPPLYPYAERLVGSLLLAVLLVITLVLVLWRTREVAGLESERTERAAWDASRPASAFDYAAAQAPGTNAAAAPSATPAAPPPRSP